MPFIHDIIICALFYITIFMASSSTRKPCANNGGCKQPAAVNCEGCSQAFCIKHLLDHRRFLGEEMNVIISEHDQFPTHAQSTDNQT